MVVSAHSVVRLEIARKSRSQKAFHLAQPRRSVSNCDLLSEPALRRLRVVHESSEEPDDSLRRFGNQPASSGAEEHASAETTAALPLTFDEVFRRYAPYVGAIVLQLIGRPGDVDDVVQDVFIQAHRGLPKLRDPAAVRPWLRRIAVRRARRWLRTRWVRRWFRESDVDAHVEVTDPAASPEERAQVAHVYRMLDRMPRDERLVWVLRYVEGETLESVAELLGCSVSTVQRRLRAAQALMGEVR
jgi:RNA polymerase sigma-70 factor (ECF subfamily)